MLVAGSDLPPEMRPFALALVEAIKALQTPQAPTPLYACATADLPPPGRWPRHAVFDTTLKVLVVSDGGAWIRQDTGEPV
ncbi:MAG: hypothetical protein ACK41C_12805 [Phenylobacterium sp.]|uniref:hypothetical protein n=1 Tax=Phenylobacterium sp. TaxID=1871053 RepID=UPI00391A2F59